MIVSGRLPRCCARRQNRLGFCGAFESGRRTAPSGQNHGVVGARGSSPNRAGQARPSMLDQALTFSITISATCVALRRFVEVGGSASPSTERCMSVTSSGRSSINSFKPPLDDSRSGCACSAGASSYCPWADDDEPRCPCRSASGSMTRPAGPQGPVSPRTSPADRAAWGSRRASRAPAPAPRN